MFQKSPHWGQQTQQAIWSQGMQLAHRGKGVEGGVPSEMWMRKGAAACRAWQHQLSCISRAVDGNAWRCRAGRLAGP